jgi:thioredoxin-related protein
MRLVLSKLKEYLRMTSRSKKSWLLALLSIALVSVFLTLPCSAQIAWQKDVSAAVKTAQSQRKYVFILVTNTETCPYCKKLEEQILTDPQASGFLNKSFVPVKLNSDSDYGKQIRKLYGKEGKGIPNMAVLAPNGAKLGAFAGCPDTAQGFVQMLTLAAQGK